MKFLHPVLLSVFISFSVSSATAAESSPFYFGLSNAKGDQVILYNHDENIPGQLHAILPSGGNCLLTFVEKRARKPEDTGRQTAKNFDNLGGVVFQAPKECLAGDRTVVLIDSDHLDKHTPVPVKPDEFSPVDSADITRIESAKKMKVQSSWNLAGLGPDATIALVQFLPQRNKNIASLVLITKKHLVFEDYRGSTKNNNSVWRVDDGGILNPRDFQILAAFRTPSGIELIRAWAGFEGESAALLREEGAKFLTVLTQYRYWVGL
ncbi:MAG: hypothetical protein A2X56_12365 [Nitrospirae bacterium GWC2_57_13]|nr:MAG: hypothetical protein A2X56_12365 [Nitrospirae bacterium GWC2_57_13]